MPDRGESDATVGREYRSVNFYKHPQGIGQHTTIGDAYSMRIHAEDELDSDAAECWIEERAVGPWTRSQRPEVAPTDQEADDA